MDKIIYRPKPNTLADRAIEFIESATNGRPTGSWVANLVVCQALGVRPNAIRPSLDRAIQVGLVEKSTCKDGYTQWRLGVIKPRKKREPKPPEAPRFGINWPPGFVSQFDSIYVPAWEGRK